MNNVDKQYCDLLSNILENGHVKGDRTGTGTISIFGGHMRIDLKKGFPLLTTKKMYTKGIIHELLWFLKGDTNIKYLVDNNVHIWDDDAYRYYKELVTKHNEIMNVLSKCRDDKSGLSFVYDDAIHDEDFVFDTDELNVIDIVSKDEFLKQVSENQPLPVLVSYDETISWIGTTEFFVKGYTYGDLGQVYGKMWRDFNGGVGRKLFDCKSGGVDQIKDVINKLLTNPDDRRMIVTAWNPSKLSDMALPPCHLLYQFYTRELSLDERLNILRKKDELFVYDHDDDLIPQLDVYDIPKRELSLSFYCRSQDVPLGTPFNIASYALLTHMIAHVCNMTVGELIYNAGDCHVYLNQINNVEEQIKRDPNKYNSPTLWLNPEVKNIDDFTFNDIKINGYQSYDSIKIPLSTGV